MTNAKAQLAEDMSTDGCYDLLYDPASELDEIIQMVEETVALNPETGGMYVD